MWEKFPSYDATNCILLDNHIEKCEVRVLLFLPLIHNLTLKIHQKNPLGTCLIVPDFILDVPDDSVISPEGEIAQHLRAMTEPDPQGPGSELHLSRYISQRAGTSALFPLSYQSTGRRLDPTFTAPVPSTVEAILNQPGSETRSGAVEESLTAAGPVAPTGPKSPMEKRNPLLVKVLSTVFGMHSETIDNIYAIRYFPIFPRRKMFREDLRMIASAKDEYLLTTESLAGGTPLLVVVDPGAKQLSLLFSDLSVHKVSLPVDDGERAELEEWMDDLSGGMTVFVVELSDSECHKELVLTVLDVAMLNGTTTSQQDLLDRVARASGWLFSSPLDDLHLAFCGKPGRITCREYTALSQVSAKTLGAMVSSVNSSSIDSLVFIPKSRSWQDHVAYQWQPAQRNTVDVSIGLQELAAAVLEVQRRQGDSVSVRGIYRHEATAAAESLSVSVSIAAIPREVAHLLEAKAAGEDAESCLVVCRLALQGAGGGDDWVAEAVEFHPLSERRVVSAEDIRCVRRALSENICLSDLLRAVD